MMEKRPDNQPFCPAGKRKKPMTIRDTIDSYRKRRKQMTPIIVGSAAILLVVVGIIILVVSLSGGSKITLFASKTPTPHKHKTQPKPKLKNYKLADGYYAVGLMRLLCGIIN
jgi:flagellar basal body-associated protein FliL